MATFAGVAESDLDLPLGVADQSCKECRRRKARCDKAMPTCTLCIKYGRHCLYEKHSRTPLTRRHLTEVEERLERAEALIRRMRRNETNGQQPTSERTFILPQQVSPSRQGIDFDFGDLNHRELGFSAPLTSQTIGVSGKVNRPVAPSSNPSSAQIHARPTYRPRSVPLHDYQGTQDSVDPKPSHGLVETPPRDDFEWDELDTSNTQSPGSNAVAETGEEDQIKDGMASLTVTESETGYLGVASGAALLRFIEPNARPITVPASSQYRRAPSLLAQPDPSQHIVDSMIDAYFSGYHLSYPIIHEPTFRAQYSEVIPQPHGRSWQILAYIVAALGVFCSATSVGSLDLELFARARSMLSFDFLETGNLTLLQALTLISNYQQKRDKPNSGYNYLGLAVRMATGLGLHKEFPGWNISPLNMEIRRRVWWSLCVFDVGATITFSRPMVWPYDGVEVAFPMNVTDRELTANSKTYPRGNTGITPYTAVGTQARFHVATNDIYSRVISKPFPSSGELLRMDAECIESWLASLPPCFTEGSIVPSKYALAHAVMQWRYRNLRIIMYRPFVIRKALNTRQGRVEDSAADLKAYSRCLADAKFTIESISKFWDENEHNRLDNTRYFLFQAALIPCICLRNAPLTPDSPSWSEQISMTLRTIKAMALINPSSARSYQVIVDLCGQYLRDPQSVSIPLSSQQNPQDVAHEPNNLERGPESNIAADPNVIFTQTPNGEQLGPIDESPQTQINQVFPMMWPNVTALEAADEIMGDDAWLEFLRAGDGGVVGDRPVWEER